MLNTDKVLKLLRENGCRITRQRKLIVDVIMGDDFISSKDIYYQVRAKDKTVGLATVYRMIKTLEEIGVINRIDTIEINRDFEKYGRAGH